MSTLANALTYARARAQTDSNGLTDALGIVYANEALFDFHRELVSNSIDASQIQEAYRNASVPSEGNGSTFLYPEDAMFLKAIEVNYQDTNPQNYVKAEQVDHANLVNGVSFSYMRLNQSAMAPKFADNGDWYEIFPAFTSGDNLTQAIRIIYFLKPTEFTSTADTIAYPSSLDYRILGSRIAATYKNSLVEGSGEPANAEYARRVTQLIATLGRGAQQPLKVENITYGANGWSF